MPSPIAGEVLFEFMPVGNSMRVTAVHEASGTEVTIQTPLSLSSSDMQSVALKKLAYVMQKKK